MSTFGYNRELKKYEEVDEDELLATLSTEELQELERELADIDPDDNVPIGLRQKDQTAKIPTGSFDRDALLKYWEDENKRLLEDENMESNQKQEGLLDKSKELGKANNICKTLDTDKKKITHKEKKTEKTSSNRDTKGCEQEKKDECKKEALIGSKKNYLLKAVRSETTRTETTTQNVEATTDRASGNPIVLKEALEQILSNDPTMTEVNLNNIEDISQETLLCFAEALCSNTHVHIFSLANTHADDRVAFAFSDMLRKNSSIKTLNVESNFVSGQGLLALLTALQHNKTLVELRFHNQRHICGGKVEMEMIQLLRENTTLLKLGYQFDLPGPRMAATGILTRNQDQQRQRRLQQKREQSPLEVSQSTENKPPKKPLQLHHNMVNQKRNPLPQSVEPPTRKIAEMAKQHDGSNSTKLQINQKKPKLKKLKNGANEKESADILKDLKNALKPLLPKRKDEGGLLPSPQRSSRDDLMAAIRGSSISVLKRVDLSQT